MSAVRRLTAALVALIACSSDDTGGDQVDDSRGSSEGSTGTTVGQSESSPGEDSADASTSSQTGTTVNDADATTATQDTSGDWGLPETPFELCAQQVSEAECEAVDVNGTFGGLPPSECGWIRIYPLATSPSCEAGDFTEACILFSGFSQGCGGFACGSTVEEVVYYRESHDSLEAMFRPFEICGPEPQNTPGEPEWLGCQLGCPQHIACTCICDALGFDYELSPECN